MPRAGLSGRALERAQIVDAAVELARHGVPVRIMSPAQTSGSPLIMALLFLDVLGEVAVEGGAADAERCRHVVDGLAGVEHGPSPGELVGVELAGPSWQFPWTGRP